jgi:hypothetical protein
VRRELVLLLTFAALFVFSSVNYAAQTQTAASPANEPDLSTVLMQSTFKITDLGPTGTVGTAFIVGKPLPTDPSRASYVLVTADHVLAHITGQRVILWSRQKQGDKWQKIPVTVQIRDQNNKPVWVKNPRADVAAMYVTFPDSARPSALVSTTVFADDQVLEQFDLRPGDRVFILGYPLNFESPSGGFPILRAGWVASYPLVPSRSLAQFLISFEVFPGNSGGPVYLIDYNRWYNGNTHIGVVHFLLGLVSQEEISSQMEHGLYPRIEPYPLDVAIVIPAALILDTINMLPAPPP